MDKDQEQWLNSILNEDIEEGLTDKQWRILEAAVKAFSEKGFGSSRTSDIAKEADVAEGTIFRYYKTKKDLLIGLLIPLSMKFVRPLVLNSVKKIMEKGEEKPLEEVLGTIFMDRVKLARRNISLIKTVVIESIYHPELLEALRSKLMPQVVELAEGYIKENIKKGEIRDLDPRLITRSLMSLLAGYLALTSLYPDVFPAGSDEEEIEKMVDIFLHGIIEKKGRG